MRISDLSIKNPVMAWMIMFFLMIFGAISFSRLGISQFPDVDFPTINISIALPGASPEVIESNIIEPVEDLLTTLEGVKNISSSSRSGVGNISIEFELERGIDVALQEVQTKVAQAQRRLPKDAETPVITKSNPDDQPIIWLAVTTESQDRRALMKYTQEFIKDQFTSVAGVGDIQLGGFSDPILRVQVIPEKLKQYNITIVDVMDAIQSEHNEQPGGQVDNNAQVFNVRVKGEAKTLEEFRKLTISKRAGQFVSDPFRRIKLSDVAKVELTLADERRGSQFNGQIAVGLGVKKQRGTNAVAVARAVKAKMELIKPNLQPGYDIKVNFDTTRFIERSIAELNKHLILAVILTALVCWVFLGSFSATFNVLLSIPTSILGTFIALYFLNFTLNTFTLLGLTLAIGIVVDDAIMVLENIFRYSEKGYNKITSAIVGSREIAFAALAATAAVIAIFLPVAFMKGIIGKYFLQFGVTISFAVFLSLIESLTITPMRCAAFVTHTHRTTKIGFFFEAIISRLQAVYEKSLNWSLNNKIKTLVASFSFLIIGFYIVKFVPKEFVPAQESGLLMARIQLPTGTSFAVTQQKTKEAEADLRAHEAVTQVFSSVGGFGGGAETNTSMMFVSLKPKNERKTSQQDFIKEMRENLSKKIKARVSLQDPSSRGFGGGGRGYPIEFVLKGPDWNELVNQANALMDVMKQNQNLVDVDSNLLMGLPEIQVLPQREKTAASGISISSVASTINAMIGGARVGQYADGGKRYDIRVELEKGNNQVNDLEKLFVSNSRGNFVPLSRVVEFKETQTLQQINRQNRLRSISIYANLNKGARSDQAMAFIQTEAKKILKPQYFIDTVGASQSQKESFQGLILALVLGLVVAYMILGAQFNSFIDPVTILMALPFSVAGAFFGLLITSQTVNIYSMIGILLLMGIVKKNSILLVEFANQTRDLKSLNPEGSMLASGQARLRPILMTSLATIAGAIPSALARGEGSELTKSMAITIIFGVFFSTLLTLYVIPCFYVMLDRFQKRSSYNREVNEAFREVNQIEGST